ncbi:Pentatricopeptide repeat-containing protein, chloroplastic [Sesamum angolense]|uniref:Pentatricopeptide repeat-containing protein, chloroplastic n=1 Tax=Sesamum angolense TaxID=2727404 RepID=A0AAE1XFZ7_9LAMI|nr:Pentatricopeptide repeat-containing protein, chloroplastic [Sesamum angolense]
MSSLLLPRTPPPTVSAAPPFLSPRTHIPPHVYKHPAAILLELCTSMKELQQFLPLIIKNGLYNEHLFQTKLVSLFCKFGSLNDAVKVFDPIESKIDPLYHTLLKGYAQQSNLDAALKFFCRMKYDGVAQVVYNFSYLLKACADNFDVRREWDAKEGLRVGHDDARRRQSPDMVTVVSILPASANIGNLRIGRSIHSYVLRHGLESYVNVATALLDMYAKCGLIGTARRIFDGMASRTVVSWNSMIDGYAQSGHSEEALELFQKMLDEGFKPSNVTVMGALHACANLSDIKRGQFIHKLVDGLGLGSDVSVMNSLISMYCKCKRVDLAAELFYKLKEKTLVSWNAMILGYAQNGRTIEATTLFCKMQQQNMRPDRSHW